MRCVTLLLTGVPRYVTLPDLSYNLDRLFNTDEIATFKIRDLPNHPLTNKRQIALDFRSGYDAMAAQDKLEGYTYELENGREYTLHAKVNKLEEYMRSGSWSPEYSQSSQWYGEEWMALTMIPNVSDRDMFRAHARLDAQLELLKKQKLVLEKEKELLNEKQKLKRQYGCMQASDSENNVLPSKRSRSRSRSRELRLLKYSHRSQSKDRYVLPQIEWHDIDVTKRELRSLETDSRSLERRSRDRRSCSLDSRDPRYPGRFGRTSRERRSRSNDADHQDRRPMSRERGYRARSRSEERTAWSKDKRPRSMERRSRTRDRKSRSRERRSRSREQKSWEKQSRRMSSRERRSRSKDRILYRRSRSRHRDSKSRERTHYNRLSRSDYYRTGRRLRSPDRKIDQLYQSYRPLKERTPTDSVKYKSEIKNKVKVKIEENSEDITKDNAEKKENKTDIHLDERQQEKEKKKIAKYNSKLRKAEKQELRVQTLSKDIMILTAVLLDEIMDKEKIKISASNKVDLIKQLENIVQERLGPLAKVKKNTDIEVMKSYKAKYPMEDDIVTIKRMLERIPKLELIEPQATVIVPSASDMKNATNVVIWDVDSDHAQEEITQNLTEDTQVKHEAKEEPVIIDLDSADKPVPRHPHFVLVIKSLVKNMNKVIRANNLGSEIKFAELKHVLRHILRNMLKGQGYVSRDEIIRRFREVYPKEQDERFVRDAIQDIKDGKYPGLSGHVVDTPESDAPDDVVIIEKHYDVISIADSDDEADIQPKVSQQQDKLSSTNPDSVNPEYTKISPSSPCLTASANLVTESRVNDVQDKPSSADPGQTNTDPHNLGQVMTGPADTSKTITNPADPCKNVAGPADPGKTMTGPAHLGKIMTGLADPDKTISSPAQRCKTMEGPADAAKTTTCLLAHLGKTISGPTHLGECSTDPGKNMTGLANRGKTMAGPAHHSKIMTGPTHPSKTMTGPAHPSKTMTSPVDPGRTMAGPAHLGKILTGSADPDKTILSPAQRCKTMEGPADAAKTTTGLLAHLGKTISGPTHLGECSTDPGKNMTGPANRGKTMAGPAHHSKIMTGPTHPSKTMTGPAHPSKTMTGPGDPCKTITGPANTGQGMINSASDQNKAKASGIQGIANPIQDMRSSVNLGQVKTRPINTCQANVDLQVPAKSLSKKKKNQKTSLENTIQNLERSNASNVVVISSLTDKAARRARKKKNELKLAGKEIQEPRDKNSKATGFKEEKDKNTSIEENDNNLKVTAITIVTSLNELIAKTTSANKTEEEKPIDDIKKEVEFIEESELDESSLTLADNVPRVTSITIMTSDAELFSLGQDHPKENHKKEIDDIKNETDVYYDAEDNLINDIEHAFNDASFNSDITVTDLGNKSSENNSEQLTSENSIEQFRSKTPNGSQNNKTVHDEEETIESIVKYVASLY